MLRLVSAAIAVLFSSSLAFAWPSSLNETIDQTNYLVNGSCSGTLIDVERKLVLTAAHCVGTQYKTVVIEDVAPDGTVTKREVRVVVPGEVSQLIFDGENVVAVASYRVTLLAVDGHRDLALLQIMGDIPNTIAAHVACDDPVRGDDIYIVGNPYAVLYSNVIAGIVSSMQRDYGMLGLAGDFGSGPHGDQPLMQISGGVVGGNSGGSVYNEAGELIGVPVLGSPTNEVMAFAVPLSEIKAFLLKNGAGNLLVGCTATS